MEKTKVKVTDIIDFKASHLEEILKLAETLDKLRSDYKLLNDPFSLDQLKIEFDGHLSRFGELYSKTKAYKDSTHVYFEQERKRIKADTLKQMTGTVTSKKDSVYAHPYYVERMNLIIELRKAFIKIENQYTGFNRTYQSIIQTISLHSKNMEREIKSS